MSPVQIEYKSYVFYVSYLIYPDSAIMMLKTNNSVFVGVVYGL